MLLSAIIVGGPLLFALWLAIFLKWQRGVWMLLIYLPFAGVVTLLLRPSPVGTLFKDFLFVIPVYAVFFVLHTRELRRVRVPQPLTLLLTVFGALVLLQLFNPNIRQIVVGLIGVKLWLMYLPLIYVGAAFFDSHERLVRVLRVTVAIAAIPCVIGIVEFILSATFGYRAVMTMIYGSLAEDVTQGFTSFYMGARFYRIPSIFSYVAQYSGYCLMMIPVIYIMQAVEPEARWRNVARVMMGVVLVASMLTGSRGMFLFAPMLYLTILFLDAKLTRLAAGLVFVPLVIFTTLQAAGLDVLGVFGATTGLARTYGSTLVLPDLIRAILSHPFGAGVGANTGQAVNLMTEAEKARAQVVEGYYAKAAIELGFAGMMLVFMLFGSLILYGIRVRHRARHPAARSVASAILAFIVIMTLHSAKGWQIDLDPINVWYWLLVGLMFQLPYIDFSALAYARRPGPSAAARLRARTAPQAGRARGPDHATR